MDQRHGYKALPRHPRIRYAKTDAGLKVARTGYEPMTVAWADFRAILQTIRDGGDARTLIREVVGDTPRVNGAIKRIATAWLNGELRAEPQPVELGPDSNILTGIIDTRCSYDGGDYS